MSDFYHIAFSSTCALIHAPSLMTTIVSFPSPTSSCIIKFQTHTHTHTQEIPKEKAIKCAFNFDDGTTTMRASESTTMARRERERDIREMLKSLFTYVCDETYEEDKAINVSYYHSLARSYTHIADTKLNTSRSIMQRDIHIGVMAVAD